MIDSLIAWKLVFDSLWKSFQPRFHGILENMRKHRDLVDREAAAIDIVEAKKWRSERLDELTRWRTELSSTAEKEEKIRLGRQVSERLCIVMHCARHHRQSK